MRRSQTKSDSSIILTLIWVLPVALALGVVEVRGELLVSSLILATLLAGASLSVLLLLLLCGQESGNVGGLFLLFFFLHESLVRLRAQDGRDHSDDFVRASSCSRDVLEVVSRETHPSLVHIRREVQAELYNTLDVYSLTERVNLRSTVRARCLQS